MSKTGVKAILQKAIADDAFRSELNSNFDAAITGSGADLTLNEREALKQVNWSAPLPPNMAAADEWVRIYSEE